MTPRLIVLHYTAMESCSEAYTRLCDPAYEVSAHWLIGHDGVGYNLVDEKMRAWHAGLGCWGAVDDVNSASIGIEIANDGHSPFPEPQMSALERLLSQIMARWDIPAQNVIAHSDLAPERKIDPGPHFDWQRLALAGLSIWPKADTPAPLDTFYDNLRRFGYPDVPLDCALRSFRLRFRPWCDGPLDEMDAALAADLAARFPVDAGYACA